VNKSKKTSIHPQASNHEDSTNKSIMNIYKVGGINVNVTSNFLSIKNLPDILYSVATLKLKEQGI